MKPFSTPERYLRGIDADSAAVLVASAVDIALVVDEDGVVRDLAFGDKRQVVPEAASWLNRPLIETVTEESLDKIRTLLEETDESVPSRWRQVNHPSEGAADIPIMYRAVARDDNGNLVLVGRDLRAVSDLQQQLLDVQHSMERDYARLHQAETRYRMLFTLASEGILVIDADARRIVEANPAAGRLLGRPSGSLVGRAFPRGFSEASTDAIEEMLTQARAAGRAEDVVVRTAGGNVDLNFGVTLLRREDGVFFLVRLSEHGASEVAPANQMLLDVVHRSPDAFVVTDPEGRVLVANAAFVDLCGLGSELQARGQPLESWLGRPGVDVELLRKNLRQRSHVRQFATALRPEFGDPVDVELSAVSALDADEPCLGFVIRQSMRPAPSAAPKPDAPFAQSLQDMTELIGRVPLKELVRETSDIIERLCIEAALRTTNDNRASAAELLGLSRQSLYVKLKRYGLENFHATGDSS